MLNIISSKDMIGVIGESNYLTLLSWFSEQDTSSIVIDRIPYKVWYEDGLFHRTDNYACKSICGNKYWYFKGLLHRFCGPAIELANGDKFWYKHGKYHRVEGPAVEFHDGRKSWYLNGIISD